jgi:hypothetical protein
LKISEEGDTVLKTLGALLLMLVVISPTHAGQAEQTNYQYDALGRLLGSTTTCGTGGEIAVQIDYDAASNRSRYRVSGNGTMLINRENTTLTPLGSGSWRLRKTGGTDGAFDTSAESNSPVSASAKISARSLSGAPNGFIAFSANPSATSSFTNLDFGMQIYWDGAAYIYEGGGHVLNFPINQKVWLWREGSTVKYGTGADFATASTSGLKRTVTDAPATLYFDSSLSSATSDFEVTVADDQVNCGVINVVNHLNTTVTSLGADRWRIQKTGGGAGAFDASAHTLSVLPNNVKISARPVGGSPDGLFGFSTNAASGTGYVDLSYGVQVYHNGYGYIYEGGTHALTFLIDQRVWVWREGSTVSYGTGPSFAVASTTGLKRSVTGVTAPLFFDSSIASMSEFEIAVE